MMRNKIGLTMVELIVSLAIMSIVLVSLFQIFQYSMNGYKRQTVAVNLQMDSRTFFSKLSTEIRKSDITYIEGSTLYVERGSQVSLYEQVGNQVKRNGSVVLENVIMFQKVIVNGILEVSVETLENNQSNNLSIKLSLGEREGLGK